MKTLQAQDTVLPPLASNPDLMSAREACALLQIKPATLYTYVSRGLLSPVRRGPRKGSLYWREEIEDLRARTGAHAGHGAAAATALRWGHPVMNTSVTEITAQGPRYRGYLALDLVRHPGAFENVAELLWSGVLPQSRHTWPVEPVPGELQDALRLFAPAGGYPQLMRTFAATAMTLGSGTLSEELRQGSFNASSRQMLFAFAGCFGLLTQEARFVAPSGEKPLAAHVAIALGREPDEQLVQAINAALILSADHEFASATFAARIAASAESGLHACIVSALATHRGSKAAGGCDMVEDVLRTLRSEQQLQAQISDASLRRERLPGFGIHIYPAGDPRGEALMEVVRRIGPRSRQGELALRFVEAARERLGIHPNLETGLVMLSIAFGLPRRTPSALWSMGRTAGWIAHVLEQRLAGFVLRPRGNFQAAGW